MTLEITKKYEKWKSDLLSEIKTFAFCEVVIVVEFQTLICILMWPNNTYKNNETILYEIFEIYLGNKHT